MSVVPGSSELYY